MILETSISLFLTRKEYEELVNCIELIQKILQTKTGCFLEKEYEKLIQDSPAEEKTAFRNAATVLFFLAHNVDDYIIKEE